MPTFVVNHKQDVFQPDKSVSHVQNSHLCQTIIPLPHRRLVLSGLWSFLDVDASGWCVPVVLCDYEELAVSTNYIDLLPMSSMPNDWDKHPKKAQQMVRAESSVSWKYKVTAREREACRWKKIEGRRETAAFRTNRCQLSPQEHERGSKRERGLTKLDSDR